MARTRGYNGSSTGGSGAAFPASGVSTFGASLIDDTSAQAARTTLGLDLTPTYGLQSGRWYRTPATSTFSTTAPAAGLLHATPKFNPGTATLDRIGAEVTTIGDVGSKVRLGIYSDDGTGRPGALLLDAGTINGDSATQQQITISQILGRGWFWYAFVNQVVTVTAPTVRISATYMETVPIDTFTTPAAGGSVLALTQAGVTGALPDPFVVGGRVNYGVAMHVRVA